ncbi:MAG: hypothetical protein V1716_04515 [Candidatus Uhrbacteria bacterium]
MEEGIMFKGVIAYRFYVISRIRNLATEKPEFWSRETELDFLERMDRLGNCILNENRITTDQLNESTILGPRAMQYLQGIDAWLTEQDPRLVSG